MHLHDLLGDREPEPSATSGLGQRAVDLMELLENARALLLRDAWASIRNADVEVTVHGFGGDAHLARVGELDSVADEIEQHLGEALLIAEANGYKDLTTSVLSTSFLFWARDSVAERTVSTTLSIAYSAMFRVN